jgi:hypothetical protein
VVARQRFGKYWFQTGKWIFAGERLDSAKRYLLPWVDDGLVGIFFLGFFVLPVPTVFLK